MKVVVFGCLPVASKILELVENICDLKVIGVSINNYNPNIYDPFYTYPNLAVFADQRCIPHLTHDQIESDPLGFDLGICVRYSKFIPKSLRDKFSIGIVNFHPGILPEYAGLLTEVHAILNNESQAGATLHWINDRIDRGPIISTSGFPLTEFDTALSVYQRTSLAMYRLAQDFFCNNHYLDSTYHPIDNDESRFGYYDRFSIDGKKDISDFLVAGDISSVALYSRAFYFPGHEPSYFLSTDGTRHFVIPSGVTSNALTISSEEAFLYTKAICDSITVEQ